MMASDQSNDREPGWISLGPDDHRAIRLFFGGTLLLAVFFGAGVFVARLGRSAPAAGAAAADAPRRADNERFLVGVGVLDSQEKATDLVQQLRKQYTSAWVAQDAGDRLFHVYCGPYPLEQSQTVAEDLRQQGVQSVSIKPYQPRSAPAV